MLATKCPQEVLIPYLQKKYSWQPISRNPLYIFRTNIFSFPTRQTQPPGQWPEAPNYEALVKVLDVSVSAPYMQSVFFFK